MAGRAQGSQLTAVLFGLGAGRAKTPNWTPDIRWRGVTWTLAGRAATAGYTVAEASLLHAPWAALPPRLRRQVLDPLRPDADGIVRWGDAPARQTDQESCGAAVLGMLAAAGDPAVSLWMVTGLDPLSHPLIDSRARSSGDSPADRFAALQRSLRRRTNQICSIPTWPRRWGTPPWGAARVARFGPIRFAPRMIDDLETTNLRRVMVAALSAVQCGVPVPLYAGGDSRGGYRAAVPRHIVLLHAPGAGTPEESGPSLAPTDERLATYEPSSGRIVDLTAEDLARGGTAQPALGGWSHLTWALVPRQDTRGW